MTAQPIRFFDALYASDPDEWVAADGPLPQPPADGPSYFGLTPVTPAAQPRQESVTVDSARALILAAMRDYVAEPHPREMLLIRARAGVGKTTAAVTIAEEQAAAGKRVLFLGPRHDFFQDILAISPHQRWWYEWQPRKIDGDATTCRYTHAITNWMDRGYAAMDFCERVCGWNYITNDCPYHAQKQQPEPIVFGQHQHLWSGHPIPASLVIGDESPLASCPWIWTIPVANVVPDGLTYDNPLTELIYTLRSICRLPYETSGTALLDALGGPAAVHALLSAVDIPETAVALTPTIHRAGDVDDAGYAHILKLIPLLQREAAAALAGESYPSRILAGFEKLRLLLRRRVAGSTPQHIIWIDGTGDPRLYETLFDRPVRVVDPPVAIRGTVHQIWGRSNHQGGVLARGDDGVKHVTERGAQLVQHIKSLIQQKGYQRPGVISYLALHTDADLAGVEQAHFYAARGTNRLQDVDALFVAGTPMPSVADIELSARMVFWDRMQPFDMTWSQQLMPYAGSFTHLQAPVSGFWHDADLHTLLTQYREAEIEQAAYRSRLTTRDVDVWLLLNLPLNGLPPTSLLTIRRSLDAPDGISPWQWLDIRAFAAARRANNQLLSSADLVQQFAVTPTTARKWLTALVDHLPDEWAWPDDSYILPKRGRGQPPLTAIPAPDPATV